MKYFKILLLNSLIIAVSISLALLAKEIDLLLNLSVYDSGLYLIFGVLILIIGLIFRVIASLHFHKNNLKVFELRAQKKLTTNGIYAISRNPLYIGIILIFLGIILICKSFSGIIIWVIASFFCDWWVRNKEEKSIKKIFGEKYISYMEITPRWL